MIGKIKVMERLFLNTNILKKNKKRIHSKFKLK